MADAPRRLTDAECRAIAEGTEELVVVYGLDGVIRYVNPQVMRLMGGDATDYVGHNLVEYVHPDELERVLTTLAMAIEAADIPGSTAFKLRRIDGTYAPFEMTSGSIDGPEPLRFGLGRFATHQVALQDTIHGLAADQDHAAALRSALDTVGWQRVGSQVAVAWWDVDGSPHAITTGLPPELTGTDAAPGTVWDGVRRTRQPARSADLAALDPSSRAAAEAAGLGGYWIQPVDVPRGPALVSVWTREGGFPPELHSQGMELASGLVTVILRFADQQRRLDEAASRDPLTGLANRRLFFEQLERAGSGAVLYADLDRFKPVNDQLGHAVGDALLQVVADRLRASVRDDDLVARLGGDEFAVLCPGATEAEAEAVASRIRDAVAQPAHVLDHVVEVGISVGVAHQTSVLDEAVVDAADRALYRAKATSADPG